MAGRRDGLSRRTFMRSAAAGVAVGALVSGRMLGGEAGEGLSKVVAVKSADALSEKEPDAAVLTKMLGRGSEALGGGSAEEFWGSLFSVEDVVGIKLNCISRGVKPNKALIDAVVERLKGAGVRENNVIVWDRFEDQLRRRARLTLNRTAEGVRVYGTETPGDSLSGYDDGIYYESDNDNPEARSSTGNRSLVSKIVTTDCTKIINMPVLKDHNQAGITACLKNLAFGSVNNTARFHRAPLYCSPAIADILSIEALRAKTVLHVLDGLKVCYNGGPDATNPAFITEHSTIYLARDPVACDAVALEVIMELRAQNGLVDLNQTSGRPVHIEEAARKGLGTADISKIDLVRIEV